MSLEQDIARLALQEERLRFKQIDEADAWALGCQMRAAALARKMPFVIDIRVANRPLFTTALPGSTPENPEWVRRKINTVMRFHKSSYRVGLEYELRGVRLDQSRGVDPLDFAAAGGGFPIHVIGTGVVGTVTVSGVPQRDDHNFVVEMLCQFLTIPLADVALAPERSA
ncbi:MAG: heme-degrading domain-containing protein [Alphaproteobacteria bacterium]|nr:heme-degrading domain-containing protein [Alphaproteobacteria bacterium]